MDYAKESLRLHYEWKGKLEMTPRAAVDSKEALSLAYTPGVAQPCLEIQKDVNKSYELTRRWNTGISHISFSRRSISKQRGAEMSSRLMPPKEPEMLYTV